MSKSIKKQGLVDVLNKQLTRIADGLETTNEKLDTLTTNITDIHDAYLEYIKVTTSGKVTVPVVAKTTKTTKS